MDEQYMDEQYMDEPFIEEVDFWPVVFDWVRLIVVLALAVILSCFASVRMIEISGIRDTCAAVPELEDQLDRIEAYMENPSDDPFYGPLYGKKIVYDGDSIVEGRRDNGGGFPALIAEQTGCTYANFAKGGARLCTYEGKHSVVENLVNLPDDGDLYCFGGGINDFWSSMPIGECDPRDYSGNYDTKTICGAMETIFTYCLEKFPGKPICFVITHKVQKTAFSPNKNGDTFMDYRNAMIAVCEKYSIPYYDAFGESGLNGFNKTQNELFLTGNPENTGDGTHPNEEGYRRYYVPQLIDLFRKHMPAV